MEANIQYTSKLDAAFKDLLNILSSLTEEQLNTIPFEGSWTAGQVGDHLLKSYGVAETLNGRTAKTERPIDAKVKQIEEVFLNFGTKLKSPEFIIPTNEHINKSQLIKDLTEKTMEILEAVKTKDLSETCLDFDLPVMGKLTRLEWASFVHSHTLRHIHQLKNIEQAVRNPTHTQENRG